MIDYPDTPWTKLEIAENLANITSLIQSNAFDPTTRFTPQTQTKWIDLIMATSDLVRQAALAGKRIDFTEDINEGDITCLLNSMRRSAFVIGASRHNHPELSIIYPALNHFYGAGNGHFSNGLLFQCEYVNELAFFVGRDRIYFYRHIMRAFLEARCYLLALP